MSDRFQNQREARQAALGEHVCRSKRVTPEAAVKVVLEAAGELCSPGAGSTCPNGVALVAAVAAEMLRSALQIMGEEAFRAGVVADDWPGLLDHARDELLAAAQVVRGRLGGPHESEN